MECDKYCKKKVGISQGGYSKDASWDNDDLSFCRQGCGLKWGGTRCERSATPLNFEQSKAEALKRGSRLASLQEIDELLNGKPIQLLTPKSSILNTSSGSAVSGSDGNKRTFYKVSAEKIIEKATLTNPK